MINFCKCFFSRKLRQIRCKQDVEDSGHVILYINFNTKLLLCNFMYSLFFSDKLMNSFKTFQIQNKTLVIVVYHHHLGVYVLSHY